MRVLMVAPTPFFSDRGCHVRIYEEIKALRRRNIDVFLCTYHHGRDVKDINPFRIINIPWYKKFSAGPSLHKFYVDPILLMLCLKKIKDLNPDILHCHLHEGALIGLICKMYYKRIPVIFDMQGSLIDELKAHNFMKGNRFVLNIMRSIEKWIVSSVDEIISSSEQCAHFVSKEFHIDSKSIEIVPDGIDTSMFMDHKQKGTLKRKYRLPLDKKIILYLGVLNKYQGIDLMLEAIQKIASLRKDFYFVIMGYPNIEHYKSMTKKMGIEHVTRFTGKIPYEEIPSWLGCGDIAVSPKTSATEANGKILNYMAAGLPTVVFNTPINWEILGDNGIYADISSHSLSEKIIELLDADEKRKNLSTSLQIKAYKEFSWDNIVHRILDVYENSLNLKHLNG